MVKARRTMRGVDSVDVGAGIWSQFVEDRLTQR